MREIVVITEYIDNKPAFITEELIACALEISAITGSEEVRGAKVKVLHIKGINSLESEKYKSCLVPILKEINPSFILMGHTAQGIDIASGLAVRLGCTSCITGVNKIVLSDSMQSESETEKKTYNQIKSDILFSRSVFKGKLNAVIRLENFETMTLLTIQPGSFSIREKSDMCNEHSCILNLNINSDTNSNINSDTNSNISSNINSNISSNISSGKNSITDAIITHQIEYGDIIESRSTNSKLTQAKVIVAAGRGIGERENIEYIEKLATYFTGSAVAGSRPLIDMGWMPYEQQVGITGAVVAPELYIAIGISGSSQHIAGMKDSKLIVSINKDPNAAIFNVSDICIVEDYHNFIQTFNNCI